MRFGKTREEQTRDRDWFAWYPVKLEDTGQWCWLELVRRVSRPKYDGIQTWEVRRYYQRQSTCGGAR